MKKFVLITLIVTVMLFWTAVHRPGGSLQYGLLIKPYPTFDLAVGAGEEKAYQRKIDNGEIPEWLLNGNYIQIASGDLEDDTKIWEYLRGTTVLYVVFAWPLLFLWWAFSKVTKHLTTRSRKDALPRAS